MDINIYFGNRIKEERLKLKLSQEKLALEADIDRTYMNDIEKGSRNISLKESSETLYWITLLHKTNYLTEEEFNSIYKDCEELKKLLMSITKNTIVS